MATFLLAWNPKRWIWEDLVEMADDLKCGRVVTMRWSCGKSKSIKKGDRVFLIRLGEAPKGIMASGIVLTGSYEDLHWNPDKAKLGQVAVFVQVQINVLLDPETDVILPREILNDRKFSSMHWDTQISGVKIPDEVALELEKVWANFSTNHGFTLAEEIPNSDAIYEGALHRISVNSYERNPEARRRCLEHFGVTCTICGFNFATTYGIAGEGIIHVHHLKELAEIREEYEIDPVRDLRPVCPNCHAILHRRKPAYSIEEVKEFLRQTKQSN